MKIALMLTGHARSYSESYGPIKDYLLDKHDVDTYIGTWSVDSPGRGSTGNFATHPTDLTDLKELFNPKAIHVEDHDSYYQNRFPPVKLDGVPIIDKILAHTTTIENASFWVERIRDQWALVKKTWDLINDPNQYDIIVRMRLDTRLKMLTIEPDREIVFPPYQKGNETNKYWSDWAAYGPPSSMKKYCSLIDHIESALFEHNINIAHADELMHYYIITMCQLTPYTSYEFSYYNYGS